MFPNPQASLPLPQSPSVEQYKKLAKDLQRAAKSADEKAVDLWARTWVDRLVKLSGLDLTRHMPVRTNRWKNEVSAFARKKLADSSKLSDAQFVIARSHGFTSWPKFLVHLDQLRSQTSPQAQFEAAADAIVAGDAVKLNRLLRQNPKLVRERSTREHGAELLHYVSANGVEGYRQKSPKNIVDIASLLLDAGAEIDATCHVYGSDCTTLGLAATSVHPDRAGVMNDLLQLLLDRGAKMDIKGSAGNAQTLVFACLANGRLGSARYLASQGAPVDFVSAAALDDLTRVQERFNPDGSRRSNLTKALMQEAFRYACGYGANRVVEFLLERGADLTEHSGDGQTGTHYTVIFGQLATLKLLLKHNTPLECKNEYGGTVLGQAMWSAAHGGDPDVYAEIFETLIAAGAKVPERHVPINPKLDALLERYGSHPEPKWWWYGEGPQDDNA